MIATLQTCVYKRCPKCGWHKLRSQFPKDKSRPDGLYPYCKVCNVKGVADWRAQYPERYVISSREQGRKPHVRAYRKGWEKQRRATLKRLYGIDGDEYRRMLDEQGNACAICKRDASLFAKDLSVDHDHKTGVVRGLLCGNCNPGIGNLQDNPDILRAAIDYLERPR